MSAEDQVNALKAQLAAKDADNASLRQRNSELGAYQSEAHAARERIAELEVKLSEAVAEAATLARLVKDHASVIKSHVATIEQNGSLVAAAQQVVDGLKKLGL